MEKRLQMASSGQGKTGPPLSLLASSPKGGVLSHGLFSPSAPCSSPALQTIPSNHLFDPETSPPSSPCPESSMCAPRALEASPAPAKVSVEKTVSAASRPRRSRHRPASNSSSEEEDNIGSCRPFQKRLRHSVAAQQDKAQMSDPSKSRETATSNACRVAYQAAIRGVGSAQSRRPVPSLPRGSGEVPVPKAALIPEEEYLDGEWLELDSPLTCSSRPSTSRSDYERYPVRPQTLARQSRTTRLDGWCTRTKAGDGSLTAEPPENPSMPRTSGPSKENCSAGQPLVGARALPFQCGAGVGGSPSSDCPLPLFLPPSLWSSLLPSGYESKFRITFSSSLSCTGKACVLP